jgi:DNA-binding CsgD family transcriptional regulator
VSPPLLDRHAEIRAVQELAEGLAGRTGLVLGGEPGIGTSALLRVGGRAGVNAGARVVVVTPVPAHAGRPLAVARELLRMLGSPAALLEDPEGPGVGLAAALAEHARRRPTLLLLDDLAWVDDASWDALTEATRMLHGEPVALLAAGHDGDGRLRGRGLEALHLRPLVPDAAAELLRAANDALPIFVRLRVLEAASGNPLAIRELASVPAPHWGDRCVRAPAALPLTPRLSETFVGPVLALSSAAQDLLLAAAANDGDAMGEAVEVAAATSGLSTTEILAAGSDALERRVVETSGTGIRFRNEVARTAVYQAALLSRRHATHSAFAAVLADRPTRAAWHRAAASLRPDEGLAELLQTAAVDARAHGRIRAALATMDRAARVSQSEDARVLRLLDAGEMSFEIGRPDFVASFLAQASGLARTAEHRRRVSRLNDRYEAGGPDDGSGPGELTAQAERSLEAGDVPEAHTLLARLSEHVRATRASEVPRQEILASVDRLGGVRERPILAGLVAAVAPEERGLEVVEVLRGLPLDAHGDPRLGRALGLAAVVLGDDRLAVGFLSASISRLRLEGRLGILPHALLERAWASYGISGLAQAREDLAEAGRLAEETEQPVLGARVLALRALLEGVAGDAVRAGELASEAERRLLGRPGCVADVHLARGLTALSCEDYDEAYDRLVRLWDDDGPAALRTRRWLAVGELAEAAVGAGRVDEVRVHVEALAATVDRLPASARLAHGLAHARAILAPDDEAEVLFAAAAEAPGPRGPLAAARLHLAFGMWLRRQRRIVAARRELRAARTGFGAVGAERWAQRATQELRAAGAGSATVATGPQLDELTPQELQIAELAAMGLSNREIGQRLFLSHRTIGSHLYRVFPKLGITTRAQLRDALSQVTETQRVA